MTTAFDPITVTDAVHASGGTIFASLLHTGRIGHPSLLPDPRWSRTS